MRGLKHRLELLEHKQGSGPLKIVLLWNDEPVSGEGFRLVWARDTTRTLRGSEDAPPGNVHESAATVPHVDAERL